VAPGTLDFELTLANGTVEIEQTLVLQATDGSYVYLTSGSDIVEASTVGTGTFTVFEANAGTVGAFAIDATHLYWTSKSSGFVKKKPLAGGSTVTVACAQTSPLAIAVNGTHVYFGTSNSLKRVPK